MTRLVFILAVALLSQGAEWLETKHYNVDRFSPRRTYRVEIAVTVKEEGDILGHFTEQGKERVSKGQETIYSNEWNYRDNWEPTFIDRNPVVEWVDDNILRQGGDNSHQPFTDELMVTNATNETIKFLGISCGKYENFDVFGLAAGDRVVLRPSPGLNPDVSGNFELGFGGQTQSGRRFQGTLKEKQPAHSIILKITIKPNNLN